MYKLRNIDSLIKTSLAKHILFWLFVFMYFIITTEMQYFGSYTEAIESRSILIILQMITAYSCLYILIPFFLTPKKYVQFSLGLFFLLFIVYAFFVCSQEFYYEPKYFVSTAGSLEYDSMNGFWNHIFKIETFLGKSVKFSTPTIILLTAKFYSNQQAYLKENEQKKAVELNTLKHQLNPHFLFNTLNNLYALTIEKSDEAPEVIAKLSEMLDYMLYGCNDKYVPIQKEIDLIDNYLALEKIRYGNRVTIKFNTSVNTVVQIAPLIILTFIENAFKHGVSQELNNAFITIDITLNKEHIAVHIKNSISKNKVSSNKKNIGLTNVKKQLELLYANTYSLNLKEENDCFNVSLKLPIK